MDYLIFSVTTRSIARLREQVLPVLDPGMVSPHQIPEAMGTQPRVLPAPTKGSPLLGGVTDVLPGKRRVAAFQAQPPPPGQFSLESCSP